MNSDSNKELVLQTPDELFRISLLQLPTLGETKRVEIQHHWPNDASAKTAEKALRKLIAPMNGELFYNSKELLNSAGPLGYWQSFRAIDPKIKNSGYSLSEMQFAERQQQVKIIRFSYPSLMRLNSQASHIAFISYNGGMYEPLEFIEAFAFRGEVLVANKQPFELHDHVSPHIIGWLSTQPEVINEYRQSLCKFLARSPSASELYDKMQELDKFSLRQGRKRVAVTN